MKSKWLALSAFSRFNSPITFVTTKHVTLFIYSGMETSSAKLLPHNVMLNMKEDLKMYGSMMIQIIVVKED